MRLLVTAVAPWMSQVILMSIGATDAEQQMNCMRQDGVGACLHLFITCICFGTN